MKEGCRVSAWGDRVTAITEEPINFKLAAPGTRHPTPSSLLAALSH